MKINKKVLTIFLFLVSLNLLILPLVFSFEKKNLLEVNFLDVGQGDSIFIESSEYQILIDGGPDKTILQRLGEKMPFWDRSIDLIILTHPDNDHISGLIEVLKYYDVKNILWTGVVVNTPNYKKWLELILEEEANIYTAERGQRIIIGNTYIDILHPFNNLFGREFKDVNDTSIVSKIVLGEVSFLLTGDISSRIEKELVAKGNLKSSVLKVAHHGSKYSSSQVFIESVSPQIAVIQVGNNSFGHPHANVLNVLQKFGINILRNDNLGTIELVSNGKIVSF